ncbi:glycosyltransferase family 1 protein [Paenibacillus sp. ATY16]|uniref:glycosyltransferase family 4 protein n=1 Tax=Paenibacillus sp. ATY16 TaxID=1759312 RepID=UPI00200FD4B7|nr:glycosyltransferase family 1 protein [Paenibacillus sp. ATY16]MCK9860420.1 glycosyltransferase family 1 protein [Paenibacillus sp. ATY16]
MRVALFTDTFEPDVNGVARTLGRWTDYLKRQGAEVLVLAPDPATGKQSGKQTTSVERFASLPFFLYPECRLALPNPIHIRRALKEFNPTIIHVATPFNLGLCGIHYARKLRIPLVASYHTHFDQYLPFYNLQWMAKLLWRYMEWFHQDCRSIYVPSRSTYEDLKEKGWDDGRLEVWSRGIDTEAFHPSVNREEWLLRHGIDNDRFVVLYVGRLAPEKNVDIALDAFAEFRQNISEEAVFVIAGDGPSSDALKERCRREGIDARFIGFTTMPDLQKWYASADLFLFPSATETFGNVVLEAMSCGTPVICADKGGVTDSVQHGVTGLQCNPEDPRSFTNAMGLLYSNPELRAAIAGQGRIYSQKQSWNAIFDKLAASFERYSIPVQPHIRHKAK